LPFFCGATTSSKEEEEEDVPTTASGSSSTTSGIGAGHPLLSEVERHSTVKRTILLDNKQLNQKNNNGNDSHQSVEQFWQDKLLETNGNNENRTALDVVIIDGLSSVSTGSKEDDNDEEQLSPSLASLLYSLLVDHHGILAIRLVDQHSHQHSHRQRRDLLFSTASTLANAGFGRIIDYSLPGGGSGTISSRSSREGDDDDDDSGGGTVLVAFTDKVVAPWHLNEAHWNLRLRTRMKRKKVEEDSESATASSLPLSTQESSLIEFDSATMLTLEYPPKRSAIEHRLHKQQKENVHDEDDDDERYNHGYNPHTYNVPREGLTVRKSSAGENAGRGVFVLGDVPPRSYLNLEASAHPIRAHWKTSELIIELEDNHELYEETNDYVSYLDAYGYLAEPWGQPQYTVDSGLMTFVNHGCNGTFNCGLETNFTEVSIDLDNPPTIITEYDRMAAYDPIEERRISMHQITTLTHDVTLQAGDELFDNYMGYGGVKYLVMNVEALLEECGGAVGLVEQLQNEANEQTYEGNDDDDDDDDEDDNADEEEVEMDQCDCEVANKATAVDTGHAGETDWPAPTTTDDTESRCITEQSKNEGVW